MGLAVSDEIGSVEIWPSRPIIAPKEADRCGLWVARSTKSRQRFTLPTSNCEKQTPRTYVGASRWVPEPTGRELRVALLEFEAVAQNLFSGYAVARQFVPHV